MWIMKPKPILRKGVDAPTRPSSTPTKNIFSLVPSVLIRASSLSDPSSEDEVMCRHVGFSNHFSVSPDTRNGAKPVVSDLAELRANSMAGRRETEPFWLVSNENSTNNEAYRDCLGKYRFKARRVEERVVTGSKWEQKDYYIQTGIASAAENVADNPAPARPRKTPISHIHKVRLLRSRSIVTPPTM
ncbi:hypothetical protein CPB86DRAFT_824177 [Serendipita vermifera]|nr:hypothetical protein CPB86DRAFT_824177 [Serendipita vermifera]